MAKLTSRCTIFDHLRFIAAVAGGRLLLIEEATMQMLYDCFLFVTIVGLADMIAVVLGDSKIS